MVNLPSYFLTRPSVSVNSHEDEFQRLEQAANATGVADLSSVPEIPVWAFLCWLCDKRGYVAHGTGQADIAEFEPRQSNDIGWFGNRKAVYASSDAIWAMFFAIMNRPAVPMTVVNGAVTAKLEGGPKPLYFFGASRQAVENRAYRDGWVYLLPSTTFECEPGGERFGIQYDSHHCASLEPVTPAFRVRVRPEDFPFLERIHAYDDEKLQAQTRSDPDGFPWLDD